MPRHSTILAACIPLGVVAAIVGGCSGTSNGIGGGPHADGGGGADSSGSGGDDGSAEANPDPLGGPHALGIITLGESHAPSGGTATPLVIASFIPDASATGGCSTTIAGCTFFAAPSCGPASACGAKQLCEYDKQCHPACTDACTAQCAADEECYFPSPGQPSCRKREGFDAGALAFSGTTTPITLFPPYTYQATSSGSPFLAGASLEVQGSGATGAGFDAFDETFTATTFLQTSPRIDQTPLTTVFGAGSVPISWAPGQDTVVVGVSGAGGYATCTTTDASGRYDVPRAVITAAIGNKGGSAVSISVQRVRRDLHKDLKTHGSLLTATVQPTAWLELVTSSMETASFHGCTSASETLCSDGCHDTQVDPSNCGKCGNVCPAGDYCSGGSCMGTSSDGGPPDSGACLACEQQAEMGACSSETNACFADASCTGFLMCVSKCAAGDTACRSACATQYPTGATEADTVRSCICANCASCATQCGM
jgi:hypothetical protein